MFRGTFTAHSLMRNTLRESRLSECRELRSTPYAQLTNYNMKKFYLVSIDGRFDYLPTSRSTAYKLAKELRELGNENGFTIKEIIK